MVEITIGPEGTGRGGGVCENLARGTPSGAVVASWYVTDPPPPLVNGTVRTEGDVREVRLKNSLGVPPMGPCLPPDTACTSPYYPALYSTLILHYQSAVVIP